MKYRHRREPWVLLLVGLIVSGIVMSLTTFSDRGHSLDAITTPSDGGVPPSVIIFIGDGMGPNQIELGRLVEYGPGGNSSIFQLPNHKYIGTDNVDGTTTDSAAAATAIATGYKTHNYVIGKNALLQSVSTILELAEAKGYVTGMVVTSPLNHATPAGFSAHNDDRNNYVQIAADMADSGIDLLLGGGSSSTYFGTQIANLQANGYTYVTDRTGLAGVGALPVLGLFNANYLTLERDRTTVSTEPSLQEMVAKSIALLNASGKPFALMVEGSQIDTAAHASEKVALAHEVIEFEKAVKFATTIAASNANIQLLVCADHETGGFGISSYTFSTPLPQESDSLAVKIQKRTDRANQVAVTFSAPNSHTSTEVYLAGMGPYTSRILNASHHIDTFQIMRTAIETSTNITVNTLQVSSPVDITIQESTKGKSINWTITSSNIEAPTYAVYKNGSLSLGYENRSWSNNTPVSVNIDPLPPGHYNFTIFASDHVSTPVNDTVIVTVLNDPPAITHPGSLAYEYGSSRHHIAWNVSDPSVTNGNFVIRKNGNEILSGSWNMTGPVNITVNGLGIVK
jgi:alkaline phosphatase